MAQRHFTKVAEFRDKYDAVRTVRAVRERRMHLQREDVTPALALTKVIGAHVSARLRELRLAAGISYQQAADKAGLRGGKQRIYAIEHDFDTGVRLGTLYLLCKVYGADPRTLLPDPAVAIEEANIVRRRKDTMEIAD